MYECTERVHDHKHPLEPVVSRKPSELWMESGSKTRGYIPRTIVPTAVEEIVEPNVFITYGALEIVGQSGERDQTGMRHQHALVSLQ